jgi:hypothetical protein
MRRSLLLWIFFLSIPSLFCQSPFVNKRFWGLSLGGTSLNTQQSAYLTDHVESSDRSPRALKQWGAAGSAQVGRTYTWIELLGFLDIYALKNDYVSTVENHEFESRLRLLSAIGASLKFGPFERDGLQPYGKVGLNVGLFKTIYTESEASYTHKKMHARPGFAVGAGVQTILRGHRGFLDYTFTAYNPIEYSFKDEDGTQVTQNTKPLRTHKIMVGVHFLL